MQQEENRQEEKRITGYPSIDKPWLKYYSEEAIQADLPNSTVYEYLYECNRNYMEESCGKICESITSLI